MDCIRLSNHAFEGHNNVYLFEGEETTLVDTGDRLAETRESLEDELAERGLSVADVDRILLTHWHGDHTGLAGDIQDRSGATVHVHAADAPLVEGGDEVWDELSADHEQYIEEWGMPDEERSELRSWLDAYSSMTSNADVTTFEDGDTFDCGDGLTVVHAPGHTAGMCLFELGNGEELLSGDALLPKYTPNVGGADLRVHQPLETYLQTLSRIADADYDRAWPGHRDPIETPTERADEIIAHHEERAWTILDAIDRIGPCDIWTVSEQLFGSLEGIHILHGPGEVYAHLDHLERTGTVVQETSGYRLGAGVSEELSTSETTWPLEY